MAKKTERPSDIRALIDQTARGEVERIKTEMIADGKLGKAEDWRIDMPPVGTNVDVYFRIREGEKTRVQRYSGTVIRHKGTGIARTITVRRIVAGEGVERIFPIYSPKIERIEITKHGRIRRAKLYYLRDRVGKGTRLREVIRPGGGKKAAKQEG